MSLLTIAEYSALKGATLTGADATAMSGIIAGVCDAAKRILGQHIESQTLTNVVLDAPCRSDTLLLPQFPVSAVSSIKLNTDARGVVANFADTTALVAGEDYRLVIDDPVAGVSKRGKVQYLRGPAWGYWSERPVGMLSSRPKDAPGAVLVSFTSGYAVVPESLQLGLALAATLIFNRRRTGAPVVSSSWNGRSVTYAGPWTEVAVLHSPDVWALIKPFGTGSIYI